MRLAWYEQVVRKWQAGIAHVFLLYGNTSDVVDGHTLQDLLVSSGLCSGRKCVILYDRAKGISFPLPSHREAFYHALGMDVPPEEEEMLPVEPAAALRLITRVLSRSEQVGDAVLPYAAAIISYAETVAPAGDVSSMGADDRTVLVILQELARDPRIVSVGPPVFLITENPSDVHPALRSASSRVELVKIPYPSYEERLEYIRKLGSAHGVEVVEPERLASLTAGLKRVHIEDIVLRAALEGRVVDAELVKQRKDEIVKAEFADVLELLDPEHGFEAVGGMEHVKEFFRRNVIEPLKAGNTRRVPMGVLLTGPPGTGKTVLAQAVAKESGLNCAALNMARIYDKWVGSSERALEKALMCLDGLAPVLVIIDEIDQIGLSRSGSGDSGVSNRIFKRLLEYMSDTRRRGKVVFVGITNRPDLLDPALKRPGRFDRKVPVLPPGPEERKEVFRAVCRKYGIRFCVGMDAFVSATEGWTGAEIEALVLKAAEYMEDSGGEALSDEHLRKALTTYVPTTRDVQQQIKLALAECNDLDVVPPEYRHLIEERHKKEERILPTTRTLRKL